LLKLELIGNLKYCIGMKMELNKNNNYTGVSN